MHKSHIFNISFYPSFFPIAAKFLSGKLEGYANDLFHRKARSIFSSRQKENKRVEGSVFACDMPFSQKFISFAQNNFPHKPLAF